MEVRPTSPIRDSAVGEPVSASARCLIPSLDFFGSGAAILDHAALTSTLQISTNHFYRGLMGLKTHLAAYSVRSRIRSCPRTWLAPFSSTIAPLILPRECADSPTLTMQERALTKGSALNGGLTLLPNR